MAKTGSKHTSSAYIMLSDKSLIDLARGGEQMAFTILFERYHNGLMSHINKILIGDREKKKARGMIEEPQDVCQETFNKAFGKIHHYNSNFKFSTWLYNIATNTAIDYTRKMKKDFENSAAAYPDKQDVTNTLSGLKDNPEERLIGSQGMEHVMSVIDKLPKIYREVIKLHAVEEYAYEEIAKKLGISLGSVKVRLNRAKNLLAEKLIDSPLAQKRSNKNKRGNDLPAQKRKKN